ncbi:MAG: MBL fold metallo-hydrolase [Fimbriiglobus sp.]
MKVQVLTSPVCPGHATTGLVVDGRVAIDAGGLGWFASVEEQAKIGHILLTHAHIDHIAGLPILVDNVYQMTQTPPTIFATAETWAALRAHLFNDVLMPDFIRLGEHNPEFLRPVVIAPKVPFHFGPYIATAYRVDHTIPTVAYTLDDGQEIIGILTDSLPQPELLAYWARLPRLAAIYLEASFPTRLLDLAQLTKHHTASDFLAAKQSLSVPVYPIHIKPRYAAEVLVELHSH